jgi:pimeloyl-ACP methyl ester carboxylesterase
VTDSHEYVRAAGYDLLHPDGGALLLALHGLGGDRRQPLAAFADGMAAGIAVLAPDARAHGETAVAGPADVFALETMADDALALVRHLGQNGKPIVLAGISMGAALALRLLLRGDLDVRGAVLIRPAFGSTPFPDNLAALPLIATLLDADGPAEAVARFVDTEVYRSIVGESPSAAASLVDQFAKPSALERSVRLREVPRNVAYSSAADLEAIDVPVLVIGACRDPLHPFDLAERWAADIPTARLLEVPARDDDPDGFADGIRRAVVDFVERELRISQTEQREQRERKPSHGG